jgi:hypothetical protein
MNKFLKKIALYGISSFIILNLIAFLCLYFLGKSCFYKQQFIRNGVKDTTFDYVVLGSSTGLTTLDTKLIDSISGKNGLNISIDDSGLSSHYLMLQQFYSSGKKTDLLVLSVMPDDLEIYNPLINTNDYRFMTYLWDKDVKFFFKNMNGKNKWVFNTSYYLPLIGVSYFNSELFFPGILSVFQSKKRNLFDQKGNYSYPNIQNFNITNDLNILNKNVVFKNPYLFKIVDFCNNYNIKILLYQSPILNVKTIYSTKINMVNHSTLLNSKDFFYDYIHVNQSGRKICSEHFASLLINNSFGALETNQNDF